MAGLGKYFNSTTTTGRANVAKATYGAIALMYLFYRIRNRGKKTPTSPTNMETCIGCNEKDASDGREPRNGKNGHKSCNGKNGHNGDGRGTHNESHEDMQATLRTSEDPIARAASASGDKSNLGLATPNSSDSDMAAANANDEIIAAATAVCAAKAKHAQKDALQHNDDSEDASNANGACKPDAVHCISQSFASNMGANAMGNDDATIMMNSIAPSHLKCAEIKVVAPPNDAHAYNCRSDELRSIFESLENATFLANLF